MKRSLLILILCLAALSVTSVTVLIPGFKRCRAIEKFLDLPGARQRASVVPSFVHFDAPQTAKPIDMGYATFDLVSAGPVTRSARGTNGTVILINAGRLRLLIFPPFSSQSLRVGAAGAEAYLPPAFRQMKEDPIAGFQEIERAQPLPLSRVFWMNNDAFVAYSLLLSTKAESRIGSNEVICFTAPHAKGIIEIGFDPTDRRHAILNVSSPDGKLNVGFNANLDGPADGNEDIGPILRRIASSFQFTIDAVPAPPELARLIAARGIPRHASTQPSQTRSTTRPG